MTTIGQVLTTARSPSLTFTTLQSGTKVARNVEMKGKTGPQKHNRHPRKGA